MGRLLHHIAKVRQSGPFGDNGIVASKRAGRLLGIVSAASACPTDDDTPWHIAAGGVRPLADDRW